MATKQRKTDRSAARVKRRLRPAAPKVARVRSSDAGEITSKPMLLGYARVSTVDQNLALQRDALTEAGCTKIFTEQMSGAVTDRPALHDALEFARSGDTLIVWKLDRLARSMKLLIETIEELRLRGIGFHSLTEALDTTTAQGRLARRVCLGTVTKLGVRLRWSLPGTGRWRPGNAGRSRCRACRCRPHSGPGADGRHRAGSSASAATCSSGGSPGSWLCPRSAPCRPAARRGAARHSRSANRSGW